MKNRVKDLQANFVQILREENKRADCLAKAVSAKHMLIPNQVLSFVQPSPLIDNINVHKIASKSDWTTSITSYLKDGVLPDDKEAARKLKVQVAQFVLIKDILYKRGFSHLYLRCLISEEADYVMWEVHEGVCGNHSGLQSLVHKLMPLHMSKLVTSARGLAASSDSQQRNSLQWRPYGLSLRGDWTSWVCSQ